MEVATRRNSRVSRSDTFAYSFAGRNEGDAIYVSSNDPRAIFPFFGDSNARGMIKARVAEIGNISETSLEDATFGCS